MKLQQASLSYGESKIVDSINLEIGNGEILVLMGPSGSGKSTLLKGMAGLLPLASGEISWPNGKGKTGLVFQEPRLFPHMTVLDNLAFGLRAQGMLRKQREAKVRDYLEILQLQGLEKRYPHQLSGGQKQRVSLGRVLVLKPDLLLLDEPFASLDTPLRLQLTEWLYQLQREQGFSILWVTHYLDEAYSVADRVAIMLDGKLEQIGRPLDFYQHPKSEKVAAFFALPNRFPIETWKHWMSQHQEKVSHDMAASFSHKDMGWIPANALFLCVRGQSDVESLKHHYNIFTVDGKVSRVKHESKRLILYVDCEGKLLEVELDMWGGIPNVGEQVTVGIPSDKLVTYSK